MPSRGRSDEPLIPRALRQSLFAGDAVVVCLVDSAALSGGSLQAGVDSWLAAEEKERAARITSPVMRREHIVGRLVLRLLYSELYPRIEPGEWHVGHAPGGRPFLAAPPPHETERLPAFSLAHSGGHVALALHLGGEPGVDIETRDRAVDGLALARRYFALREADALERLSEARRREAFLQCWTLKEASVKADGAGLAGQMRRRCFPPGASGLRAVPFDERTWQYWSWSGGRHCLGVALRHPSGEHCGAVTCRVGLLDPLGPTVEWLPGPDAIPSTIR